jgi:CheY-like chemotaxis protein
LKTTTSILLVEDDADDVFFISRALRGSGLDLTVEVVNDGQAAVEFLTKVAEGNKLSEALSPCLVLLDLNIPFKSGLEVLKWIRAHAAWKTIIVIVLTSSTSESDMIQAYTLGANSYVIKPSDATRLAEFGQFLKGYWFGWNQLPPACRPSRGAVAAA